MTVIKTLTKLIEGKQKKQTGPNPSAEERRIVLGQLAASNIASHADAQTARRLKADIVAANDRVESFKFADPNIKVHRSNAIVEAIIWMLQSSELTIQFPPGALFSLDPKVLGERLKNTWDLPGGKTEKYLQLREDAEALLFNYAGSSAPYAKSHGDVQLEKGGKTYQNPSFATASRPLYSAINFPRFAGGGAGMTYGEGVLSLRPHIALNSTFTEQDSFKVTGVDKVGTYLNLYPLIANCNASMLNALADVAISNKALTMMPGYLEAQNHCGIVFARDVAAVRMAEGAYSKLDKKQLQNFTTFLKKNGLVGSFTRYNDAKDQLPLSGKKPTVMVSM